MPKPPDRRSGSIRNALVSGDALPRIQMAVFAVVFVIAVAVGLILGIGPSALAIGSIAGGVASLGVQRIWLLSARRRRD